MLHRTGRVLCALLALAAVVPFFHFDHHASEGCSVCTFASEGSAQAAPVVTEFVSAEAGFHVLRIADTGALRPALVCSPDCRGPPAQL